MMLKRVLCRSIGLTVGAGFTAVAFAVGSVACNSGGSGGEGGGNGGSGGTTSTVGSSASTTSKMNSGTSMGGASSTSRTGTSTSSSSTSSTSSTSSSSSSGEAGASSSSSSSGDAGKSSSSSSSGDAGTSSSSSSGGDAGSSSSSSSGSLSDAGDAGDASVQGPLAATKRVLLISVDGLHQVDLANWIAANPTSTLAKLANTGVEYTQAHTTTPSDSFPGMVALVTGASPKSAGVYYDDSYDRTLYAPGPAGCGPDGGVDGGSDASVPSPGTEVVFDESIEVDDSQLFSAINPANLPWQKDAQGNCTHVYPHNFIRVNTVFEVIKDAGAYTAWSDKHPAYEILSGPSGQGIDDLYTPEIKLGSAQCPRWGRERRCPVGEPRDVRWDHEFPAHHQAVGLHHL